MSFRASWSPNFSRLTRTSAVTGGSLANNTLACWFRVDDLSDNYEFIQIDTPGESNYQALIKYDAGVGGLTFLQRNSNGSDIAEAGTGGSGDAVIPTTSGAWHHVAMTWDGSTLAAYVDGVQVRTRSGTPGTRGTWTDLNVGPCLGDLQDAVFYNAALSAAEIAALYSARLPKRRNNLLVHLPCFPGSNRTVDYSGLGNNFTATGSPADSSVAPPPVGWGSGRAILVVPAASAIAITASGSTQVIGAAAVGKTASVAATGSTQCSGSASVTLGKDASGTTQCTGSATVGRGVALTASGATQVTGAAALGATIGVAATGSTQCSGTAAMSASSQLPASGTTQCTGTVQLQASFPITASGLTTTSGSANTGGAIPIPAVGSTRCTGTAQLTSTRQLTANGLVTTTGFAALSGPLSGANSVHLWRRNRRGR